MPADGAIQLAFDRYLLPATTIRQAFLLLDGNGNPLPVDQAPRVIYDPVARTVTLASPRAPGEPWLTEGQLYKLVLLIPEGDTDQGGLRAIDRAVLDPRQPRVLDFFVGPPTGGPDPLGPKVSFCGDVQPLFVAKCSGSTCHGASSRAAASLVLQTAAGVANTAIGRVAQGANTGAAAGTATAPGRVFGVDMPIIEPGNPGNSWLVYKLELARPPVVDAGGDPGYACDGSPGAPPPPRAPLYRPLVPVPFGPDDIERSILSDHVLGREMPYPTERVGSWEEQALTFEERERIRLWIAQGAEVTECGTCGPPATP